jgi:hypothetical protein
VFISYANESADHSEAVWKLCKLLRENGIDARLDLVAAGQRQEWSLWMANQIREADHVLVIASAAYRQRAEGQSGTTVGRGVQWESRLIRDKFYRDQQDLNRFLPVILPGQTIDGVPDFLTPATSTVYHVHDFTVTGIEELLRLLTSQPAYIEPPLGPQPRLAARNTAPPTAEAGIREFGWTTTSKLVMILFALGSVTALILYPHENASTDSGESADRTLSTTQSYGYVAPTYDQEITTVSAPTYETTTTTEPIFTTTDNFDPDTSCAAVNSAAVEVPLEYFPVPSMDSALVSECELHPAETVGKAMNKLQAVKITDHSSCQTATDSVEVGNNYVVDEYLASKVTSGMDPGAYWVAFDTECMNNPTETVGHAFGRVQSAG